MVERPDDQPEVRRAQYLVMGPSYCRFGPGLPGESRPYAESRIARAGGACVRSPPAMGAAEHRTRSGNTDRRRGRWTLSRVLGLAWSIVLAVSCTAAPAVRSAVTPSAIASATDQARPSASASPSA